jgi:ABC-type phosphate transport system permease subunit
MYIIRDNFYSAFGIRAFACMFLGWIVLGIMSLPLVTSVSEDSLRAVPEELREASLGIGATKWQTVTRVLLSSASSGIVTAIALSFATAIGETMAVYYVIGAASPPPLTLNPFLSTNSITVLIATKATADSFQPGMPIYSIVFGAGVILFLTTALTNLVIRKVSGGRSKLSLKKGIEKN